MSDEYYAKTKELEFKMTTEKDYLFDIEHSYFTNLGCGLHIKSITICNGDGWSYLYRN